MLELCYDYFFHKLNQTWISRNIIIDLRNLAFSLSLNLCVDAINQVYDLVEIFPLFEVGTKTSLTCKPILIDEDVIFYK